MDVDDAVRFRSLFKTTYGPVRRYVDHRVGGGRADDIVAETFVVAWRRLDDVPADRPLPWLIVVARNLLLNQRRSDRRYKALLERLPEPLSVPAPAEPDDDEVAAVQGALDALAAADREVIGMAVWDGLTAADVGRALGCTPGAARVRLHRARHRLTAELAKRGVRPGHDRNESQFLREMPR